MAEHENNSHRNRNVWRRPAHNFLSVYLAIYLAIYLSYPTSLCLSAPFQFKHKPLKISSIQPLSTWKTGKITICVIFRSVAVLHLEVCLSVKYGSLFWACQNHPINCKPRHDDSCYNLVYLVNKVQHFYKNVCMFSNKHVYFLTCKCILYNDVSNIGTSILSNLNLKNLLQLDMKFSFKFQPDINSVSLI